MCPRGDSYVQGEMTNYSLLKAIFRISSFSPHLGISNTLWKTRMISIAAGKACAAKWRRRVRIAFLSFFALAFSLEATSLGHPHFLLQLTLCPLSLYP